MYTRRVLTSLEYIASGLKAMELQIEDYDIMLSCCIVVMCAYTVQYHYRYNEQYNKLTCNVSPDNACVCTWSFPSSSSR